MKNPFPRRQPPPDFSRLYAVGQALEKHRELKQAAWVYEQAARLDPDGLPVDLKLIASEPQRFMYRRQMARFLTEHLDTLRSRVGDGPVEENTDPKIFVYWAQGFDDAPPIVKACRKQLEALHIGEVIELDRESLHRWVDIPADVRLHAEPDRTHYSDLVRFALLRRYGGVWFDATCLASESVFGNFDALVTSGFFAFRYHDALISNWFLAARPGNYITEMMYQAQCAYWRHRNIDVHYFFPHHMFESLYYLDPQFAAVWDATPDLSSHPPHELQKAMQEPYDDARFGQLVSKSFVHKLTYKRDAKPGSILERIASAAA
ncbi:capsular polysaccharide synthesis protein [Streptomyces sp. NPDC051218]|uniref:capsular polysaccharide synthesis protein n=1 Tax=Streptomyces sp. NPDC051218 TaxID=3365645 RepID=UPI00379488E0